MGYKIISYEIDLTYRPCYHNHEVGLLIILYGTENEMSALSELYEQIACCQLCEIAKYRTKVVPGEGAEDADIMFIGEAPGWHEDQQGRPFVGPAGQYLEQLLASIGTQ